MGHWLIAFVISVVLLAGSLGPQTASRAGASGASGDVASAVEQAPLSASVSSDAADHLPEERPAPSAAEPSGESTALPSSALRHQGRVLALEQPARLEAALAHGPYLDGLLRPPRPRSNAA
jgi:hypothetical protein